MNAGSVFATVYQVGFHSLQKLFRELAELRRKILGVGGLVLVVAFAVDLALAHGLTATIRELVAGTAQIQRGNFQVKVPVRSRDEIGGLASSFNEMAEGLALKEKYRSVLDKVTDKEVARQLMSGGVALGGEMREISVLFCDIRGFTALTQNMDPAEVIRMLNEHFTPLTRVVYEHNGVVDKFVGDLIMAVFGAPKGYGARAPRRLSAGDDPRAARTERNLDLQNPNGDRGGHGAGSGRLHGLARPVELYRARQACEPCVPTVQQSGTHGSGD